MRHIYFILMIILAAGTLSAQKDFQIESDTPYTKLQVMMNDTAIGSITYGLGSWQLVDSIRNAFADHDFYQFGTSRAPLFGVDSIETASNPMYVLFNGLDGSLWQKIEFLKNGTLRFDQEEDVFGGRIYLKLKPLQQSEDNTDFNFSIASVPNGTLDRNDNAFAMGFNVGAGGGAEVAGQVASGIEIEDHYEYSTGLSATEFHFKHIDASGTIRKPFTWILPNHDPDLWAAAMTVPLFDIRPPDDVDPFFKFELVDDEKPYLSWLNPTDGKGFRIYVDTDNNAALAINNGMTNPYFDITNFHRVNVSRLTVSNLEGPAGELVGRSAGSNYLAPVTLGYGIDLTSGVLLVDTAQVATQYDISGIVSDHDWYEVGGTTPPNAITDEMFRTGFTAIGLNDPDVMLHVYGTAGDIHATDESKALMILESNATNALHFGASPSAPYGTWIQSADRTDPSTTYPMYLNPLGGSVGIGNQDPQKTLHVTGTARITASDGTALAPMGRDADGDVSAMTEGYGINFTSGAIVVDTAQVATPYDLTLISGGTTNLTIGGSGPDYTVESSSGTDVTIAAGTGISLSESPANTLIITNSVTDTDDQGLTITGSGPTYTIDIDNGSDVIIAAGGINALSESPANTLVITATEVDGSTSNELQSLSASGTTTTYGINLSAGGGAINLIEGTGITIDRSGDDLTINSSAAGMTSWLLATGDTGGTESITDGETATWSAGTGLDFTRSGSTATVSLSFDELGADGDGTAEGDELIITYDPSTLSPETFDINNLPYIAVEVDGSTTNELNTIEEGNSTVQSSNSTIDFQSMFDVAADGAGEVNISFDGGEATTVTTAEADDYILIWDDDAVNQKMLWSDFVIDIIGFEEDNSNEGSGNTLDFGTGIDLSVSGAEADITLDFNEFTTDAATEGDEYVILYDPSGAVQEKVLISSFGGADGNGLWTSANDNTNIANSTFEVGVPGYIDFRDGSEHDLYIDASNDRIGMGTNGPSYGLHILNDAGMALEPASSAINQILKIEGTADGGGANNNQSTILLSYTDADYAAGAEQSAVNMTMAKESDATQITSFRITMPEATDADVFVSEKNVDFVNTTESHVAINAGIAYTQNYDGSTGGSDLSLDRSYYTVNITGGNLTDTIKLPEVASTQDNWLSTLTVSQCQNGQEYVISNLRSGVNLVIGAYNPAGTSDDLIGTRTAPGGSAGSAISIAPGKSVIIKCYQLAGGIGYWNYWLSN